MKKIEILGEKNLSTSTDRKFGFPGKAFFLCFCFEFAN